MAADRSRCRALQAGGRPFEPGTAQSERFSGFLIGFVKGTLAKTEGGFEQMNAALKARVEQPSAQN